MKGVMTHIVAGYPNMNSCEKMATMMIDAGVSVLEIQIPFSDPIADGPTIMHANQMAIEQGTTPEDCFALMERLRKKSSIPLLFMTYFNIAFRYGLERFCKKAKASGAYGLIIPDIPIDEESYEHYLQICKKYRLHAIQVISPITPQERLGKIGKVASGFVYCVARTGTTGSSQKINASIAPYLKRVKRFISVPIALGFGISSRQQAVRASHQADIVVIGSRIIEMADHPSRVQKFLSEILDLE